MKVNDNALSLSLISLSLKHYT